MIKKIDFNITNSTSNSLYYGIWYEMIEPTSINENIIIAKLNTSANPIIGQLTTNQTKKVTLYLENSTTDDVIINMGVDYSETNSLNLPTGRTLITAETSEPIDESTLPQPFVNDYEYSSSVRTLNIANAGKYKLEVWGAEGGYGEQAYTSNPYGGPGGYAYGTVTLNQGDTLYIHTGGLGNHGTTTTGIKTGGANGGGTSPYNLGGSGGGGGANYKGSLKKYNGGAAAGAVTSVVDATNGIGYNTTYNAKGATISAGGAEGGYSGYTGTAGSFGTGGAANTDSSSYSRSGGGGGWYGGGSGGYRSSGLMYYHGVSGGGGGSGWGFTAANYSSWSSGNSTDANRYLLKNYTQYYLTDLHVYGGNETFTGVSGEDVTGHWAYGYARISYNPSYPTMTGLSTKTISQGTSYDLTSDVTCVDNGDGCTLVRVNITNTSTLAEGEYTAKYIVKDNNNVKYKYTRTLIVS